jgi:hypothetical protein
MVGLSPFFLLGDNQGVPEEFGAVALFGCVHNSFVDIRLLFFFAWIEYI